MLMLIYLSTIFSLHKNLLGILETYLGYARASQTDQDTDIACLARLHLSGFCLLMLAHDEANIVLRESKVQEAIRCFFRYYLLLCYFLGHLLCGPVNRFPKGTCFMMIYVQYYEEIFITCEVVMFLVVSYFFCKLL